ncbi:MAG: hypothetical protein M3Q40_02525 [Pseudomonadota bacterium]|nr:hypothetical protein [Pseudomonadota bacterium]
MRILLVLLCPVLLASCSCQRDVPSTDAVGSQPVQAPAAAKAAAKREAAEQAAEQRARKREREDAIYDAVDTLQAYLREVNSDKRDAAIARWAYRRSPEGNEEAGLRSLDGLRAMRIENGTPRQLDAETVPVSLEIPVELRATLADGSMQRYQGWYRLRRKAVEPGWEITGTSLSKVQR